MVSKIAGLGHFELNIKQIDTKRSVKRDKIALAYRGKLPMELAGFDAYIEFRVQPTSAPALFLVVESPEGTDKFSVEATAQEIRDILGRYFSPGHAKGMTPYATGYAFANFMAWEKATTCPLVYLDAIKCADPDAAAYLVKRLTESRPGSKAGA